MPSHRVVEETVVPADRVLYAARDFSARRAEVFPAVSVELMEVHAQTDTTADVTEATSVGPFGTNSERCRYDWSQPGAVLAEVIDSNVYEPSASRWEIKAAPSDGGSRVEMTWTRGFKRNPRGLFFGTLFRIAGKPLFGKYARDVLRNLEQLEQRAAADSAT